MNSTRKVRSSSKRAVWCTRFSSYYCNKTPNSIVRRFILFAFLRNVVHHCREIMAEAGSWLVTQHTSITVFPMTHFLLPDSTF